MWVWVWGTMKIRRTIVTTGVEWVEIEEADLRILCGCPADVVKHLKRRGLILERVVDGTRCETGPNAILLSDVMLQGGAFANLAEFPVLQMLYQQGLIIPDHPNNTGQMPLLMGLEEQVSAQLNYIHRGNYGLTSIDELRAAGLSEADADLMMRIKLRFAFGKIRPVEELLDRRNIGLERREIRNGVGIRRIALNRYQFSYQGETVDVDLNLKDGETYPSPYPLGMHSINRQYFSIIHSGEGDGWNIDHPCMSSLISFQGRIYLIDAGPNLEAILKSLSLSVNELDGIFHTHSHDDHFAGLTALLQADRRLRYYAVPMVRAAVTKKLAALLSVEEKEFTTFFDAVDLDIDTWNDVDGLWVKPAMSPHPVETTVFHFRALGSDGYKTYTHLADITADRVLDQMVDGDSPVNGLSAAEVQTVKDGYRIAADLKKIDIGGGLIHGDAADFADDKSDKLVLAHIARELNNQERQIGSGAGFGTAEVLIPATQEYLRQLAFNQLRNYFPDRIDELRILLNNEVRTFNPHEILLREGETVTELWLILSGNAESLAAGSQVPFKFTAGSLLGELPLLRERPATGTYRATSYLHALLLPVAQYNEFLNLYADRQKLKDLAEKRIWLRQTPLFGGGLSYPVHNRVAMSMTATELEDGIVEDSNANRDKLRLVREGVLMRFVGDNVLETLRSGDFFNEGRCIFHRAPRSHMSTIGTAVVWDIPAAVIADIPIVRWKIFETYRLRLQMARDAVAAQHQQSAKVG